jgi:subtilisin family serine protease
MHPCNAYQRGLSLALGLLLAGTTTSFAQSAGEGFSPGQDLPLITRTTYTDAGEQLYPDAAKEQKLLRVDGAFVVTLEPPADKQDTRSPASRALDAAGEDFEVEQTIQSNMVLLRAKAGLLKQLAEQPELADNLRTQIASDPEVEVVNPLYVRESSTSPLAVTAEIIVQLKNGINAETYFGKDFTNARPLWINGPDYILTLEDTTAKSVLAAVNAHHADSRTEYAEPVALSPLKRERAANDHLYTAQWHLDHTGQNGTRVNADIRAAQAWDITDGGSSNVVIAIIDDGVEWAHPDIFPNLFYNQGEIDGNNIDDDGNGVIDDVIGYDFKEGSKITNPTTPFEIHGTPCAGLAAGVANNNAGIAGVAYRSRIMPVKVSHANAWVSQAELARAILYAAGLDGAGDQIWRGADVFSMSFGYSGFDTTLSNALNQAGTKGRGGRGAVMFASTGNRASGYARYTRTISADAELFPGERYRIRFEYYKDNLTSAGLDTVWLSNIRLPDAAHTRVQFDSPQLPAGWTVGGNAPFFIENDPVYAYGTARYQARSGSIGNNQRTWIESPTFTLTGQNNLFFHAWVDTELKQPLQPMDYPPPDGQGDWLYVRFYNVDRDTWYTRLYESGTPGNRSSVSGRSINTMVHIPSAHPMVIGVGGVTDMGYRYEGSEYLRTGLEFVAPTAGGIQGVWATDRTGTDGYVDVAGTNGNYTAFSGTSAACPIAAGVGALVLSMNTNLTRVQVRDLMRNSADKIGEVTYVNNTNRFYGYGRVNAYQALLDLGVPGVVTARTDVVRNQRVYDVPGTQVVRNAFSIEPGATVTMRASRVVLQDGFRAKTGSTFRAGAE